MSAERVSLRHPTADDYYTIYPLRFTEEISHWADGEPQRLTADEYACGRLISIANGSLVERIIYCGEKPIGTISARDFSPDGARCEFGVVIADKAYWDRGIGRKSMKLFWVLLRAMEVRAVELDTYANNARAISSFGRQGFEIVDRFYAPGVGRDVVRMRLIL